MLVLHPTIEALGLPYGLQALFGLAWLSTDGCSQYNTILYFAGFIDNVTYELCKIFKRKNSNMTPCFLLPW
jgi:hypothetical protein